MASKVFANADSISDGGFESSDPTLFNPITVGEAAFIISKTAAFAGSNDDALFLAGGAYTVTVNGVVDARVAGADGIEIADTGALKSTLTVGATGYVSALGTGGRAIRADHATSIMNSGVIQVTSGIAILEAGNGDYSITNNLGGYIEDLSGMIAIQLLGSGKHSIINKGTVSGQISSLSSSGIENVNNSGYISSFVSLSGGNDSLINSGTIGQGVDMGDDDDTVTNSGSISADIALGEGNNTVTNSGSVGAGISAGTGNDKVTNSGTITGSTDLNFGNNTFTNTGTSGSVTSFGDQDKVINGGLIDGGVSLGDGDDTFSNFRKVGTKIINGEVTGAISLGDGADTFNGGTQSESVTDDLGNDTYKFGGGDDTFTAMGPPGNGDDTVDGGLGNDWYDAQFASVALRINLNTANQIDVFDGVTVYLAKKATDSGGGEIGTDTVTKIENAVGGTAGDKIIGTSGHNELNGIDGDDDIYGLAGNDYLLGGTGADNIIGGAGRDELAGNDAFTGDTAEDHFIFLSLKDSTPGLAGRDIIYDFEDGFDKIDLSHMSGLPAGFSGWNWLGVDQKFDDANAATVGDVRVQRTASGWVISADVTGDEKADFAVEVLDTSHAITWTASDFEFV